MEELVNDGHLYMKPLSAFKIMEADQLRADRDEALDYSVPASGAQLSAERDGKWLPLGTLTGALRFAGQELRKVNVFCMHIVLVSRCESHPEQLIDPRNFSFGDTFVVFTDADEFLRRVRAETSRRNLQLESAAVQYIESNSYNGPMGLFRKFSAFDFQSEYRLAILPGTGQPYSLHIGSVADITQIAKLSDINRRLRIVPPHTLQIKEES
jgi:hypothetical protein